MNTIPIEFVKTTFVLSISSIDEKGRYSHDMINSRWYNTYKHVFKTGVCMPYKHPFIHTSATHFARKIDRVMFYYFFRIHELYCVMLYYTWLRKHYSVFNHVQYVTAHYLYIVTCTICLPY